MGLEAMFPGLEAALYEPPEKLRHGFKDVTESNNQADA